MRTIEIDRLWDGEPARPDERVRLELEETDLFLRVRIDAPFHDDPPPAVPPGRCERLWEFEVVELFLVGPDERYLELEFGPDGHWLGLALHGVRNVVDARIPIDYSVDRRSGRWYGQASVPRDCVPEPVLRWNAFAIHGNGAERRHLVAARLPVGESPDFHQIRRFPKF